MTIRTFIQGSKDNLDIPITDEDGTALTDDMPVEISTDHGVTWVEAQWLGPAAATRTARLLIDTTELDGDELVWPKGNYAAHVRLTGAPEAPIELAGHFSVIAP